MPIFSIHRIEFGLRAINRIPLTVRELVLVKIFTTARVPRALALWALKTYKIFGTRTHSKRFKILLTSCLMRILGKDKKGNPTVILKPLKKRIIVGFESFRWTPKLVTSAQTMVCASEPLILKLGKYCRILFKSKGNKPEGIVFNKEISTNNFTLMIWLFSYRTEVKSQIWINCFS